MLQEPLAGKGKASIRLGGCCGSHQELWPGFMATPGRIQVFQIVMLLGKVSPSPCLILVTGISVSAMSMEGIYFFYLCMEGKIFICEAVNSMSMRHCKGPDFLTSLSGCFLELRALQDAANLAPQKLQHKILLVFFQLFLCSFRLSF